MAKKVDLLLVVGAHNSSNSNRLREIGTELRIPSYLIDDADNLDPKWIEGIEAVGITAGASTPDELVQEMIARLGEFGEVHLREMDGVAESIIFKLPTELKEAARERRQRA